MVIDCCDFRHLKTEGQLWKKIKLKNKTSLHSSQKKKINKREMVRKDLTHKVALEQGAEKVRV